MIIKSCWFISVIQSGNGHYSVDHYSKAGWFYWRWNQRICWFRCGRNNLWAVLNPVVQYSGGDDSILYGTDGIRWFYSIVHVSSIPSGWSIEVIDNHGRVEYGMMSETSIPMISVVERLLILIWWWWNQYLLFSDEWMIDMLWLWHERILLNSLYCLWVLYRLDVSVSIE